MKKCTVNFYVKDYTVYTPQNVFADIKPFSYNHWFKTINTYLEHSSTWYVKYNNHFLWQKFKNKIRIQLEKLLNYVCVVIKPKICINMKFDVKKYIIYTYCIYYILNTAQMNHMLTHILLLPTLPQYKFKDRQRYLLP